MEQSRYSTMTEDATFLRLPLELRCEVYRYLLVGVHEVHTSPNKAPGRGSNFEVTMRYEAGKRTEESWDATIKRDHEERKVMHSASTPQYAILRVSSQVYQEASAVLYTESKFWVSYEIGILRRQGFSGIGHLAQKLHRVCHLGVDIHQQDPFEGLKANPVDRLISEILAYYGSGTTSLRSLEISLDSGYNVDRRDRSVFLGWDRLLQAIYYHAVVSIFKVKENIEICIRIPLSLSTDRDTRSLKSGRLPELMAWNRHVAHIKEWCRCVAEAKDWDICNPDGLNVDWKDSLWQRWVLVPRHQAQ